MRRYVLDIGSIVVCMFITFQCSNALSANNSKSTRRWLVGFGPGYFSNMNTRSLATGFSGGWIWNLDPQLDLLLVGDLAFSLQHTDARYLTVQLKGRHLFTPEENSSWFAGAGMGLGHGATHNNGGSDSTTGFTISGAFGLKAYQKAKMQLIFEFEHSMIVSESRYGTPIFTSFKVGVIF